ncbi:LysM peptidoglycan-binding domain-containing protein [uncultured Nocardioides sp.]|uniref:LysM peptidoglycan-binding domain-containing protein n=1 Tax=uncultured Nocardioides sp. TaxID=198441 RepID=UPI0025F723D1|nr:LysM peptidoglycan-binding domain-containing protein [uncultured Nocardioides sp.]
MSTTTMSTTTMGTTMSPTSRLAPVRDLRPVRTAVAPAAGQLRLTRRGRLALLMVAVAVVLVLGVAFGAGSVATDQGGTPEPTRVVMVGEGETLWGIAAVAAGDGSTRAMVERIERLNALDTAMVTAGQQLRVPLAE